MRAEGQSAARHWSRLDQRVVLPAAAQQQCAVPGPSDAEAARNTVCNFALIHQPADSQRQSAQAAQTAVIEVAFVNSCAQQVLLSLSVQPAVDPAAAAQHALREPKLRTLAMRLEFSVELADVVAGMGQQQRALDGRGAGCSISQKRDRERGRWE